MNFKIKHRVCDSTSLQKKSDVTQLHLASTFHRPTKLYLDEKVKLWLLHSLLQVEIWVYGVVSDLHTMLKNPFLIFDNVGKLWPIISVWIPWSMKLLWVSYFCMNLPVFPSSQSTWSRSWILLIDCNVLPTTFIWSWRAYEMFLRLLNTYARELWEEHFEDFVQVIHWRDKTLRCHLWIVLHQKKKLKGLIATKLLMSLQ